MSGNARSSHQRCSLRRGVLRNFAKFTGKHLCQSLSFNKVAVQPFLQNTSGWLLLKCLNKKISKRKSWTESYFSKKVIVWCFNISSTIFVFFHTQWKVFFQIKFHPGMKFYSFHPRMKLTCKQKFFHPRMRIRLGYM